MGGVTLFSLVFISLPEAVLNMVLFLLFSGKKKRLELRNKENIAAAVITLVLMLLTTLTVRSFAPNVVINVLGHVVAYILIFTFVYRLDIRVSVFSISLITMLMTIIENLYIPFVIGYLIGNVEAFFSNQANLLLVSLPARVLQLLAILYMWKYHIVFVSVRLNRKLDVLLPVVMFGFCVPELCISFYFANAFANLNLTQQIIFSLALFLLMLMNLLILKLVFEVAKWAIEGGTRHYEELENASQWLFEKIDNYLQDGDIDGAKNILNRLNSKLKK